MSIKVITEPTIYLMAHSRLSAVSLTRWREANGTPDWFTDAKTDAEAIPEIAGRICYDSFASPRPGGNAAYLEHIRESGHGSVLEHSTFSILATGISRSLTHEWVRHRVGWAYSQQSQRYVNEADCGFVVPPALIGCEDTEAYDEWASGCTYALQKYARLVKHLEAKAEFVDLPPTMRRKRAREAARSVLPNCVETKMLATANARALRHFFHLRGSEAADLEMRRFAAALAVLLTQAAPELFRDVTISVGDDGRAVVSVEHPC